MATNKYIRGLTRAGFRVAKTGGGFGHVTLSGNTQVDLDDHKTELVLQGNRVTGAFVRVAAVGSTTTTIVGLSRRGFRIKNSGGTIVTVKVGSGVHTIDLTKGAALRSLLRNKRDWIFSASATQAVIRGTQNQQNGFYLKTAGTDTLTSTDAGVSNVSNADVVVIGTKTYTFKTNLTEKQATAVLTEGATPFADADTVTINDKTYRIKTVMAQANDVQRGATGDLTLGALIKAVNGTGLVGTDYFAGTTKPTNVTAGALSGTGATATVTFTAAIGTGLAGNAFPSTTTGAHSVFSGVTFGTGAATQAGVAPVANEIHIGGTWDLSLTNLSEAIGAGANVGVDYSSTTTANADATASAVASHVVTLTAVGGGSLTVAVTTTSTVITVGQATLNDKLVKVYRGISVTVDATNSFNFQQLRRHYRSWIEG